MASASALVRGQVRRVSSGTAKALGQLAKVTPGLNGIGGPTRGTISAPLVRTAQPRPRVLGAPPAGFPQPFAQPTTFGPITVGPTIAGPAAFSPFSPGDAASAFIPSLCDLLPANLVPLCKAGASLIPSGQGAPGDALVAGPQECPEGTIRFQNTCIAAGDLFPGGDPLTFPAGNGVSGAVVQGGFGLPATEPVGVQRVVRRCSKGMVLGIDNLCYAKAILPPRSKLRKWRRPPRPPVTRRDVVAIRRSAGARERVFDLAKDVGLHVSKTGHKRKKK